MNVTRDAGFHANLKTAEQREALFTALDFDITVRDEMLEPFAITVIPSVEKLSKLKQYILKVFMNFDM